MTTDCPHCGAGTQESLFCRNCSRYIADSTGKLEKVTFNRRFWGSYLLEGILIILTLIVGWLIWLFFTAQRSQTPAKSLLNVYTLDADTGQPVSAGRVWVRDVVVERLLIGLVNVFGIAEIVNGAFVLFDKNRRSVHDHVMNTIVVYAPRGLPESLQPPAESISATRPVGGVADEGVPNSLSDAIMTLGESITRTALLSTQPINDAWPVKPMPAKENFAVRMEMLIFVVHMVNRFTLLAGGEEIMAKLRRAMATSVMPAMIEASFDTRSASSDFDTADWQRRMIDDAQGMLDEAELEYSACRDLAGDLGHESLTSDDIIVGRLANRIFESADIPDDFMLRMLIGNTAVRVLARSGLKEQAEATSRIIAESSG